MTVRAVDRTRYPHGGTQRVAFVTTDGGTYRELLRGPVPSTLGHVPVIVGRIVAARMAREPAPFAFHAYVCAKPKFRTHRRGGRRPARGHPRGHRRAQREVMDSEPR